MRYGNIKTCDIANGIGIRTVLFVSGCTHHCEGCFQPETWDFNYGAAFTRQTEDDLIKSLTPSYVHGLTLLGGEPFEAENQKALLPFLRRVKSALPEKSIWCYTGYTYEELTRGCRARCEETDEMLSQIDVLIDGKFILNRRNISLRFRGSDNQRIIDMKKTRLSGELTMWQDD